MASQKTAISINDSVYKKMDSLARRLHIPRSQLFELAAESFLRQHRNKELLQAINQAVDEKQQEKDRSKLTALKHHYRKLIEGQW